MMNYLEQQLKAFSKDWRSKDWILGPYVTMSISYRVSQKRNLFGLEYLRDDSVKLVVHLVCYYSGDTFICKLIQASLHL